MNSIIDVNSLSVYYGKYQALSDVTFSLFKGETLCIIGPNGSGKSTLIKTLAGIIDPFSGFFSIHGRPYEDLEKNEIAKIISYVPQDFLYLTSSTVLEAVILGRRPHVKWSLSSNDLVVVKRAMEMLNIFSMSEKMLTELSGGERQRVFIARSIAQEPEVFLFDEPTSALDIKHQIDVFSMIKTFSAEGKSVIVAVHDLNFAYHYADRVMLIDKGNIVSLGNPDEVMTEENLEKVYGIKMQDVMTSTGRYIIPCWN